MGEALAIAKMTEKQWDQKWEFVLGDQHNTVIILSMKLIVLMCLVMTIAIIHQAQVALLPQWLTEKWTMDRCDSSHN